MLSVADVSQDVLPWSHVNQVMDQKMDGLYPTYQRDPPRNWPLLRESCPTKPGVIPTTQRGERIHIPQDVFPVGYFDMKPRVKEKKSLASRRAPWMHFKEKPLTSTPVLCFYLYSKSPHKKIKDWTNMNKHVYQRSPPFFTFAPSFSPFHPFHPVLSEASCVKPHKSDWAMVAWS